jgi:hypothetical protein
MARSITPSVRILRIVVLGCLPGLLGLGGCGNAKLPTSLDEAKQAVTKTVEQVKETAPTVIDSGSIELNLGQPLKSSVCLAKLSVFSAGRPSVLQLKGYRGTAGDSFPAILVSARLPEGATSLVAGQTIDADVYAQAGAQDPIWASSSDAPAQVTISAVDGTKVTGSIAQGTVVSSADGSQVNVTGSFVGVLSPP